MKTPWDYNPPDWERTEAWGQHIRRAASWTHWATVTFRVAQTERAAKNVLRGWMRAIAKATNEHFRVAWVVEPHQSEGFHIHALFALPHPGCMDLEELEHLLREQFDRVGRIQIERYDESKGAAEYIAKTGQCDISTACPQLGRCRRYGCTQGKWPL